MEIYPILYFVTVAHNGNLTRAAGQLGISPPALSSAIRRLEQNLGVPLFERTGRSIVLNSYGEAYLPYAEQLLAVSRQSIEALHQLREQESRQLVIADMTHAFASHLISEFLEQHPDLSLRRVYVAPSEAHAIDLDKTYDLAIGSTNGFRRPELLSLPLRSSNSVVAIVHRSHPLSSRREVSMAEVSELPLIAYAEGNLGHSMLHRLFAPLGKQPQIVYEGNTPHAMAPALSRNLGVFLQSATTAEFNMRFYPDCVVIPVPDARYEANTSLLWSPDRPQSPAAKLFCAFCREYCARKKEGAEV